MEARWTWFGDPPAHERIGTDTKIEYRDRKRRDREALTLEDFSAEDIAAMACLVMN